MTIYKKCNECGQVHEGITSTEISEAVSDYIETFSELTSAEQVRHFSSPDVNLYESLVCGECANSQRNFSDCENFIPPENEILPRILIG